jgi:hypothetical protein
VGIAVKCSFIVSAFDRPDALACLLYALKIQTEPDFEVIVTCNAPMRPPLEDDRFSYHGTMLRDCYESANHGATIATGEYLCFPSDDGYYAPRFLELMLKHGNGADLIYCNCVYDGHGCECGFMDTAPVCGRIDKGGFLLRRSLFTGFEGPFGVDRAADGNLIEDLVRKGASHRKVEIVGWVHN